MDEHSENIMPPAPSAGGWRHKIHLPSTHLSQWMVQLSVHDVRVLAKMNQHRLQQNRKDSLQASDCTGTDWQSN